MTAHEEEVGTQTWKGLGIVARSMTSSPAVHFLSILASLHPCLLLRERRGIRGLNKTDSEVIETWAKSGSASYLLLTLDPVT